MTMLPVICAMDHNDVFSWVIMDTYESHLSSVPDFLSIRILFVVGSKYVKK